MITRMLEKDPLKRAEIGEIMQIPPIKEHIEFMINYGNTLKLQLAKYTKQE